MLKCQESEPRVGQGLFKDPKKIQPLCTTGATELTPEIGQVRLIAPTGQPLHATPSSIQI
jgi:hypothetical protein